jgi:hypothetical protein
MGETIPNEIGPTRSRVAPALSQLPTRPTPRPPSAVPLISQAPRSRAPTVPLVPRLGVLVVVCGRVACGRLQEGKEGHVRR